MTFNAALSGGDLATYRGVPHAAKWYMSVVPQTVFATAQIDQSIFVQPLAELSVKNTSANWTSALPGMTVWIGKTAGARDAGIFRVRKTPGASTLYLSEVSSGDPGLVPLASLNQLTGDYHITIIDDYNLWSVFPRIAYSGGAGTFYKDYELAYSTQNATSPPCILRIGEHRAGFVNTTTGLLTTAWTASITAWDGATVAAYAWDVDGGTVTVGATNQQSLTVTHTAGHYIIRCTVTLSNGAVVTAQRHVWAHNTSTEAPLEINIRADRRTLYGRDATIELISPFNSAISSGTMVMCWQEVSSASIASAAAKLIGFVDSTSGNVEPIIAGSTVEIVSPLTIMSRVQGFSQELRYAASPANWQEAVAGLMHIDFFVFYILYYHTTLLRLFDYTPAGLSSITRNVWRSEQSNWLTGIRSAAGLVDCDLTQDSHGNLYLKVDPAMTNSIERLDVVERITLGEDDISRLDYTRANRLKIGQVQGFAFTTGTGEPDALRSISPGQVPGQVEGERQITRVVDNQALLNVAVGNAFAVANNPYPRIDVTLVSGYDIIEPALRYFVGLDVSDSQLLPEGTALQFRCVPLEVNIVYDADGVPEITVTLAAETDAGNAPGQGVPVEKPGYDYPDFDTGGILDWDVDLFSVPTYWGLPGLGSLSITALDGTPGSGVLEGYAVAFHAKLVTSTYPYATTVDWDVALTPASGNVQDATQVADYGVYALTDAGLHYTSDITNAAFTLQQAATSKPWVVRSMAGAAGHVCWIEYATTSGAWEETFDFTSTPGWFYPNTGYYGDYPILAEYENGVGFKHKSFESSTPGTYFRGTYIQILTGAFTATDMDINATINTTGTSSRQVFIRANKATASAYFSGTYHQYYFKNTLPLDAFWDGTTSTQTNVSFPNVQGWVDLRSSLGALAGSMTYTGMVIRGTGYNPFSDSATLYVSEDYGETVASSRNLGAWLGDNGNPYGFGLDTDDFNLGVIIAGGERGLFYTSSYTGALTRIDDNALGLFANDGRRPLEQGNAEVDGDGYNLWPLAVNLVRIPYLKQDGTLNNQKTALEFVFNYWFPLNLAAAGGRGAGYGKLQRVALNCETGTVLSRSDITPSISGTRYLPHRHANNLEHFGDDARIMAGWFVPVGADSNNVALLTTSDGGVTWIIKQTTGAYAGQWVRLVVPLQGGTGQEVWLAGSGGIWYTANFGATLVSKSGDFATETGSAIAAGAFAL